MYNPLPLLAAIFTEHEADYQLVEHIRALQSTTGYVVNPSEQPEYAGAGYNNRSTVAPLDSDNLPSSYTSSWNEDDGRDAYEFVAFLLWYLFLVLCCVVPTCCAYRRRRLVESRMAQQQASVNRLERQNLFLLSSIRHGQYGNGNNGGGNGQALQDQRRAFLEEKLKPTTMTVEPHHMIFIKGEEAEAEEVCHPCQLTKDVEEVDGGGGSDQAKEQPPTSIQSTTTTATAKALSIVGANNEVDVDLQEQAQPIADVDVDMDTDVDLENPSNNNNHCTALQLTVASASATTTAEEDGLTPPNQTTQQRIVAGACAICLCPYEPGEQVTWSPQEACHHCFHSSCLLPWLARTDEPNCPCCRRAFCDPVPLSQLVGSMNTSTTTTMTQNGMPPIPFFFSPASFAAHMGQHHHNHHNHNNNNNSTEEQDFMRSLEASQLEFMASLELAALRTSTTANGQQQQSQRHRDSYVNIHVNNNNNNNEGTTTRISMDGSPFDDHVHVELPFAVEEVPASAAAAAAAAARGTTSEPSSSANNNNNNNNGTGTRLTASALAELPWLRESES